MISIITPVLKFDRSIKELYQSITRQSDLSYVEWIIVYESNVKFKQKTFKLKKSLKLLIIYSNKNNIYEALNSGIIASSYPYYITIGQDDYFENDTFEFFKKSILNNNEYSLFVFRTTHINTETKINSKIFFNKLLYESNHSGGLLIKKEIHNKIGLYDTNFKIASDQLFIKKFLKLEYKYKKYLKTSARIGKSGITSKNKKLSLLENFIIDMKLKKVNLYTLIKFCVLYIKFTFLK